MAARYRRALLPIALLALALLLAPLPGGNTRAWQTLENAAHGPLFALLTLVWMAGQGALPREHRLTLSHYALAWVAAVAAGAVSEVAQWFASRDAALVDLGNDTLGALAALCALALWRREPLVARPAGAIALWAGLALALLIVTVPVIWSGAAYLHRQSRH